MSKCEICKDDFQSLDTHHIQSVSCGGSNAWRNKIDVCQNCHRQIHYPTPQGNNIAKKYRRIIIEGKFDSTAPDGYTVVWRREGEESVMGFDDPEVYLMDGTMVGGKEEKVELPKIEHITETNILSSLFNS